MSSYFFIALLLFTGNTSSFLFPFFFKRSNAQSIPHTSTNANATSHPTGPNSFNIVFGGSDNLPGTYTIVTGGSFTLNIENTSELVNAMASQGGYDVGLKANGIGHLIIQAQESGCKYKFNDRYTINGHSVYRLHLNNNKSIIAITDLRTDPSEAVYAPLVQGPKDCYPMYRFGFEPLLICGNGNADIDLAVGTGKQEGDGNAGREHQECTLTVQNNISSQPTPSTPKKCSPPLAGTSITPMTMSQKGIDFLEKMEGKSSMLKKFCSTFVMTNCRMDNNPYGFYNDHAGLCTVGIGHLVAKKSCADIDKLPPSSPIKQSKDKVGWVKAKVDADKLKRQDLVRYVNLVNNNVKVKLTQEQFDALVSLAFNIESAIDARTSTLMKNINSGKCDPATITSDFRAYDKITDPNTKKKIESPGLTQRRIKEANIFNYGRY